MPDADPSLAQRVQRAMVAENARLWTTLAYAGVALGCLLRLLRYANDPGLWMDESFLAINLIDKPLSAIFGSLQFLQTAPPGFLLVEKLAETNLGDAEWSLRLFSIAASLASVFLFAYVARRLLAAPAAVLAITLFATCEPLLLRAAEVKHYSIDIAVTTLVLALYLRVAEAPAERRTRRIVVLLVVGAVSLWLSFPAAFTMAGVVAALALRGVETRARQLVLGAFVAAAVALASFGLVYTIAAANVTRVSDTLFGGESHALAVGHLKTFKNAWWTFINPGGFDNETNSLAALLSVLGILVLVRRGTLDRLVLLGLPLVLAALADELGRYPLGGWFSVFLVPFLLILVARGAQALVSWSRHPVGVGSVVALFLVASPLAISGYHTARPPARSDVKPLLRELVKEWRTGDSLYVYGDSQYQLRYYSECKHCSVGGADFPWPTRLSPPGAPGDQYAPALESVSPDVFIGRPLDASGAPLSDLDQLPKNRRVWFFISTTPREHDGLNDQSMILRALGTKRRLLDVSSARGAQLYLFSREVS